MYVCVVDDLRKEFEAFKAEVLERLDALEVITPSIGPTPAPACRAFPMSWSLRCYHSLPDCLL